MERDGCDGGKAKARGERERERRGERKRDGDGRAGPTEAGLSDANSRTHVRV